MGKRELLLVIGFLIAGVVVYQATAPPLAPNERGFSISRIVDSARREIRGHQASLQLTKEAVHPIPDEVTELRIVGGAHGGVGEVKIAGETRGDIASALLVHSSAYNEEEARRYGEETVLATDRMGSALTMRVNYPEEGRQRAVLALRVPSRLRVRVEVRPSRLTVSNVGAMEAGNAGGRTEISDIAGPVTLRQRGGSARIENARSLKITARGTELALKRIEGDTAVSMEGGGELEGRELAGRIEVDARNADVTLTDLQKTTSPIRVDAVNGSLRLEGVRSELRVDGRDAELDLALSEAAPVAVYSEGEDVALTLPRGGYRLDLEATEGEINPADIIKALGVEHDAGPEHQRVEGAVHGGGPLVTVRTRRGDLLLRLPASASATENGENGRETDKN